MRDTLAVDDDEALRLNTLHRFRKHSPRLLLEEYSHCEVPAGCGGVVMRWVDPGVGIPAIVRSFVDGEISLWLDGRQLDSARVDLRAGSHTLALTIVPERKSRLAGVFGRRRTSSALLLSIVRALGRDQPDGELAIVLLSSGARFNWRISQRDPGPDWTAPEFDDSAWATPQTAELDGEQGSSWRAQQLQRHGAQPLALPAGPAWLRVRFEVPELQPEERP